MLMVTTSRAGWLTLMSSLDAANLTIEQGSDKLVVFRNGRSILTQVAQPDFRPYLHPNRRS